MTLFAADLRPAAVADLDGELASLEHEACTHPGVLHPWLERLAAGEHPDPEGALQQFARAYHGYAAWFPRYFEVAMFRLPDPVQQMPWQRRLARELGHLSAADGEAMQLAGVHPRSVQGFPRAALFRRFAAAVGVAEHELATPSAAAAQWREPLLAFLHDATAAEAVGALALGTELVDALAIAPLSRCLLALGSVRCEAMAYFALQAEPDADHLQELRDLARQLAAEPGGLAGLRRGLHTALALRQQFLDQLASGPLPTA